ncbi:hypothetical protein GCM10022205_00300 [Spinactinospora alkalitolerans]
MVWTAVSLTVSPDIGDGFVGRSGRWSPSAPAGDNARAAGTAGSSAAQPIPAMTEWQPGGDDRRGRPMPGTDESRCRARPWEPDAVAVAVLTCADPPHRRESMPVKGRLPAVLASFLPP